MLTLTDDQRYAAIQARDARFDGVFFTCVRTTGIFCRPSCPARTPGRGSVSFVASAAAAIEAGFRACKRCGPAAPPGSPDDDPIASVATRALRLIEAGALDGDGTVTALATRLAVSERSLHRALLATTGSGALTHARIRRARLAHELITTTDLPLADIAHASGFGSERQLHEVFTRIYGHTPSLVRERRGSRRPRSPRADRHVATPVAHLRARLAVRRPFDGAGLAGWFAARAIPGVESVDGTHWTRAVRLRGGPAVLGVELGVADGPLILEVRLADAGDFPQAVALTRRLLDLDADPVGIDDGLRAAVPQLAGLVQARPGIRIPGCPSLAEALVWAVTGQQISIGQTRDQLTRATDLLAQPLPPELQDGAITRFPVVPEQAGRRAAAWFRGPSARCRALTAATAKPVNESAPLPELRAALLAIPGVGEWTADYALIRGVRAIDLAPHRDAALLTAALDLGFAETHHDLSAVLRGASPWRSYAVLHLWQHAAALARPVHSKPGKPVEPPPPTPSTRSHHA